MSKRILVAVLTMALSRLASAVLVINEVCYDNDRLADERGDTGSDWIELYNRGPEAVNIAGYGVGDANPYQESKGVRLPDYTLPPGGTLVVFASADIPEYTAWVDAPDLKLVAPNAVWRYRSAAEAPPASWRAPGFDDAFWPEGVAPLGYDDAKENLDCATVLDYGGDPANRTPAAYFRTAFTVINPAVFTGLVVRARIDDGVVVYLNGSEVFRTNMPAGPVSHATLALDSVPSTQWLTARLPTNGLAQGTNVLAVEVHQAVASSADLIMDLALTGLVSERVPVVHGQFRLANEGENIHLFNAALTRVQLVASPGYEIGENRSFGASPDGSTSGFRVYRKPTPGLPNATSTERYEETLTSEKPAFSVAPGVYGAEQVVALRTPTAGLKIYYTLDGSDPRESAAFVLSGGSLTLREPEAATNGLAWIRTNPAEMDNRLLAAAWRPPLGEIGRAVVLRAVAVDAAGARCSPETCGTYFLGARFAARALPVLSLIADPSDFFGFTSGIYVPGKAYADSPEGYGENKWGKPYANYFQSNAQREWERPAHAEWLEPGQSEATAALGLGVTPVGGGTCALPQKSLQLLARAAEYGTNQIDGAFFPGEAATSYRRLVASNSEDDWYGPESGGVATMMKDAVFQQIARPLEVSVLASRPAVLYLNGEYWGLHNLRESYDKYYFSTRYGLDPENVDMLEQEEDPDAAGQVAIANAGGDANADDDYRALLTWIAGHPLSEDAHYRQVLGQLDVTNYTDYVIAETFFANAEWPLNNGSFWRCHTNQTAAVGGDGRWRWVFDGLDRAGADGADADLFAVLAEEGISSVASPAFLINALWANGGYRGYFVARYERLLNTVFAPERTAAVIAEGADAIAGEMESHFRRWGRPFTQAQWRQAVEESLVQYAAERHAVLWGQLSAAFSLGGSGVLSVRNLREDGAGGHFAVDGVSLEAGTPGVASRASWSGRFFKGRLIEVRAVPDVGYVFDGWEGLAETGAVLRVEAADAAQVFTARFVPSGAATYVVSFEAAGGAVSPDSKVVAVGGCYGSLPVPLRAGYAFAGWWTEPGGGVQVTDETVVEAAADHTLYAKWVAAAPAEATTVGVAFSLALPDAFAGVAARKVAVRGLPTGLRYDASAGAVVGAATKTGTFAVVMSAAGVSAVTVTVTVVSLPAWAQGTFNGFVAGDSGGLASMSVTAQGKVTGKVLYGGKSYVFRAASFSAGSAGDSFRIEASAKAGASSLPVTLEVGAGGGGAAAALGVAGGFLGGAGGVRLVLYRNVWKDGGVAALLDSCAGYYTAVLPGGSAFGSGYLLFTADSLGRVKTAGRLADGTTVSLSGTLLLDAGNRVFAAVYASPSAYRGGGLFGLAEFVQPEGGGAAAVRLLDGAPFLWTSSNPQATALYGEGFGRALELSGGRYSKTGDLYAHYADLTLAAATAAGAEAPVLLSGTNRFASAWWRPDGVAVAVVTDASGAVAGLAAEKPGAPADVDGDGVWDYGSAANTVGLKVSLTRATGVFKGSFKAWFDTGAQHTSKSVACEGVLTPVRESADDGTEGRGFFLWKDRSAFMNAAGRSVTYSFNESYDFLLLTP